VKDYKPSTMKLAKVALRVFYHDHLRITPQWRVFDDFKVKHRETLPVVLSKEEVSHLLSQITEPRFQAVLSLLYTCGLRISEGLAVSVPHIESKSNRLLVPQGKGRKPRYVPISGEMIQQLRDWWCSHRHPKFLFPSVGRRGRGFQQLMRGATQPMSVSSVQKALKWAVAASGLKQHITAHTLRHCYASHLLDDGISLRYISAYLGHASLDQTLVYAHLTVVGEERTHKVLSALHKDVIHPANKPAQDYRNT
jgi:integrase/recombinase XerD